MATPNKVTFEASSTDLDKSLAREKALKNAGLKCNHEAPGCPLPIVINEREHHDPKLGWTIELKFQCQEGL